MTKNVPTNKQIPISEIGYNFSIKEENYIEGYIKFIRDNGDIVSRLMTKFDSSYKLNEIYKTEFYNLKENQIIIPHFVEFSTDENIKSIKIEVQ